MICGHLQINVKLQYRQYMQSSKVQGVFEKQGYTQNAYISKEEYRRILNQLMKNGEQFYQDVAEQLWSQSAQGIDKNQVKISTLCATILEAQNILRTRIFEVTQQLQNIQSEKRRVNASASKDMEKRMEEIQAKLNELYELKQSLEEDYYLVTEPFGIHFPVSRRNAAPAAEEGSSAKQSEQLKYLLYVVLVYGFFQIVMIYGKPDFLNIIVLTFFLSLYLLNFFDKVYIRFTLALTAASVLLDLVWLILYAKVKWNPPTVSNESIYRVGYTRFIVFFTVALIPLKAGLIFLLYRYRNAGQKQCYVVTLPIMKLMLGANKKNPISKQLAGVAILSK